MSRPLNLAELVYTTKAPLALLVKTSVLELSLDKIRSVLMKVQRQHPMLQMCVRDKSFQCHDRLIPIECHKVTRSCLRSFTRTLVNSGIDISSYLLKVHYFSQPNCPLHLLFVSDHVAADGRSLYAILNSFVSEFDNHSDIITANSPFVNFFDTLSIPSNYSDYIMILPDTLSVDFVLKGDPLVEDVSLFIEPKEFSVLKNLSKNRILSLSSVLLTLLSVSYSKLLQKRGIPRPHNIVSSVAVDLRSFCDPILPSTLVSSIVASGSVGVTIADDDVDSLFQSTGSAVSKMLLNKEMLRIFHLFSTNPAEILNLFNVSFVYSNIGHYKFATQCSDFSVESLNFIISGPGLSKLPSVHIVEVNDTLSVTFTYSPKFFSRQTFVDWIELFNSLVTSIGQE
ncbi:hypothetical protein RCL1_000265 [Eukaryota sp. TZLM3-RCL]